MVSLDWGRVDRGSDINQGRDNRVALKDKVPFCRDDTRPMDDVKQPRKEEERCYRDDIGGG